MSSSHNQQDTKSSVNERTYQEVEYLKKNLGPILVAALAEICIRRPADPIEYLGHWLLRWRYNEELKRRDVQNALEIVREKQWTQAQHEGKKYSGAAEQQKPTEAQSSVAGMLGGPTAPASTNAIVEQLIVGHLEGALANEPLKPGEGQYHVSGIIHQHGHGHAEGGAEEHRPSGEHRQSGEQRGSQQQPQHLSMQQQKTPQDIHAQPETEVFENEFGGPLEEEEAGFYGGMEVEAGVEGELGMVSSAKSMKDEMGMGATGSQKSVPASGQVRPSAGVVHGEEPRRTSAGQPPHLSVGQEPPKTSMGQPPRASVGQPPRASAGQPPRASVGQPPRASVGQPPRASVGQPPRASADQPPRASVGQPPKTSVGPASTEEDPRKSSFGQPGRKSVGEPPKPSVGQPGEEAPRRSSGGQKKLSGAAAEPMEFEGPNPSNAVPPSPEVPEAELTPSEAEGLAISGKKVKPKAK